MQCDEVIKELATPTDHQDATALARHIAGCPACAGWANRAVQLDRLWEATRPAEPTPEVWEAVWARIATSLDPSTSTEVGLSFATRTAVSTNGSPAVANGPSKRPRHSPQSQSGSRPWRLAALGLVSLAQAAAILLAVGLAWHQSGSSQPAQVARNTDSTPSPWNSESVVHIPIPAEGYPVVIEEGHSVVIHEGQQEHNVLLPIFTANLSVLVVHVDGQTPKVVDHTPEGGRRMLANVQWWKKTPKVMDQTPEGGILFGVDDLYLMYNAMESMTSPVVAMKE
jgi:hypothetical protein